MKRRQFAFAAVAAATPFLAAQPASGKVGVLMLHGKNPGGPNDRSYRPVKQYFEREGLLALMPDLPWSANRYIDGNWDQAMGEIKAHVEELRKQGAARIVLAGHSMGVPAALSFAARGGDVQAIVALAPGHVPRNYSLYPHPSFTAIRESVSLARSMVADGKGAEKARFSDSNQGRSLTLRTTAQDYLSYFEPEGDAEMSVTAPRVPANIPVMTVIGDADPLFRFVRSLLHDRLPPHPQHKYLEIAATHISTPDIAKAEVVKWIKEVTR